MTKVDLEVRCTLTYLLLCNRSPPVADSVLMPERGRFNRVGCSSGEEASVPVGSEEGGVCVDVFHYPTSSEDERARFIHVVSEELDGLHEGNFLRYQVRPSQFFAWRDAW